MIVNSVPQLKEVIGDKGAFAKLHSDCLAGCNALPGNKSQHLTCYNALCGFTMATINIDVGIDKLEVQFEYKKKKNLDAAFLLMHEKFESYAKKIGKSLFKVDMLWLLKPQQGWFSANISVVSLKANNLFNQEAVSRWIRSITSGEGSYVLQEFVQPPMLYLDRKMDIRVWVIVTSIDPLRIYIMDKTIPKIATLPYDMNKPSNSPPCAAYRMMETQGCKKEGIVKPYPRNAETLGFQRMLRFKTGSNVRQPDWFYHILPKIHRQVAISLMHARDKLLKSHYEIDDEIKYKRFQFLGPDISIDAFGRVRVIDPNPNGFIISGSFFKLHEKLKSAFQIIGIDGFPKSSSGSTLEEINRTVSHFCSQHSCNLKRSSISGPLILQELMHETVHSCGWTRNFPMAEYTKEPFMSLFAKTKLFRETERDHLTMLFVKSKEFKEFAQNQAAGRKKLHSDTIEIVKNTEYYPALSCSNFDADLFNTFLNTTELYEKRLIEERGARKARFCRKKSKPIMHN